MSIDNGGSAFPGKRINYINGLQQEESFDGMTLRDYFAAKAMQAMIGNTLKSHYGKDTVETFAKYSYEFSDAMLKARN